MSSIGNALQKGYEKYYNTLIKVGYINKQAVSKLIVAQWIYDVLEGKYDCLVDDEQYDLLGKLYMCVEGSCLVPYQNYCREFTVNRLPDNRYIRVTESDRLNRFLEVGENLRMI